MNPITLSLIVLRTTDLEKARRFYEQIGLRFTQHKHGSGPEHLAAELGGCVFEIYPQTTGGASTLGTRIGFSVPSLDTVISALSDYPDAIISTPQNSPWGRRCVLADPDGHRIELMQA